MGKKERIEEIEEKPEPYVTPWKDIPMEDKVSIVGDGRAGYEVRVKHHWRIS